MKIKIEEIFEDSTKLAEYIKKQIEAGAKSDDDDQTELIVHSESDKDSIILQMLVFLMLPLHQCQFLILVNQY